MIRVRLPQNVHALVNSAHFLMTVRVTTPNLSRRLVIPQSSNDTKHPIKVLQVFILESPTTLTRKLNEADGWGLQGPFWVAAMKWGEVLECSTELIGDHRPGG